MDFFSGPPRNSIEEEKNWVLEVWWETSAEAKGEGVEWVQWNQRKNGEAYYNLQVL